MSNDKVVKPSAPLGRGSVSLSLDSLLKRDVVSEVESNIQEVRGLTKEEIYTRYQSEIDDLIKEEKKKLILEYDQKFKKELSTIEKDLNNTLNEKSKLMGEKIDKVDKFIDALDVRFNEYCNGETLKLDTMVVALVLEVLYKVTGKSDLYRELIKNIVNEALAKKVSDIKNLTIKLSKEDYIFFKKNFEDEPWIGNIKVDDRLVIGQLILDDGFSLFESGLVDQLDSLRSEFISALRSNYE